MPTVIVEDGTVVPGANSYVYTSYVAAYASMFDPGAWNIDPEEQDRAVIAATRHIDLVYGGQFRGEIYDVSQRLLFPRTQFRDARGLDIPAQSIPLSLKDAVAQLAISHVQNALSLEDNPDDNVKRVSVGVASGAVTESVEYFEPRATTNGTPRVAHLTLQPLLRSSVSSQYGTAVRG